MFEFGPILGRISINVGLRRMSANIEMFVKGEYSIGNISSRPPPIFALHNQISNIPLRPGSQYLLNRPRYKIFWQVHVINISTQKG